MERTAREMNVSLAAYCKWEMPKERNGRLPKGLYAIAVHKFLAEHENLKTGDAQ